MRLFDICELLERDFRDPTGITEALAIGSIAATVVGAGVSYMGAQQQASAAASAASYNAEVAANNQKTADAAAVAAQQEGQVQQQQKAYQEDVLIGQQKAGFAANGIDVGSSSVTDVLSDTKAAGEFDQLTITNNAARETQGYLNQGINYSNQAQIDQASSQAALAGGELKSASSLVTGAGSVANQWYNYSTKTATTDNTTAI